MFVPASRIDYATNTFMESLSTSVVSLLQYLMPGFLAAWVFYGFTSHKKPSQFERVVQALIFTLFVQAAVFILQAVYLWIGQFFSFGSWTKHLDLLASIVCAILLGMIFAFFVNTDRVHKIIRRIGVSRGSSYSSEWFGIFTEKITFVVLHLKDGRRIYGWPKVWPSTPKGHIALEKASWLDENNNQICLDTVDAILISAEDVKMVEFMKTVEDKYE